VASPGKRIQGEIYAELDTPHAQIVNIIVNESFRRVAAKDRSLFSSPLEDRDRDERALFEKHYLTIFIKKIIYIYIYIYIYINN